MKYLPSTALASLVLATAPAAAPLGGPVDLGDAPNATLFDVIAAAPEHSVLAFALEITGLDDALRGPGPLTVFAPTNDAFLKLPLATLLSLKNDPQTLTQILLLHVLPELKLSPDVLAIGGAVTLNGEPIGFSLSNGCVFVDQANVRSIDYQVSNGVIHQLDDVLLPKVDLVDALIADGRFTTLVTAVQAAGLEAALRGPGLFTLFAPTDAAFAKIPAPTLEDLLEFPNLLAPILTYHVSPELLFGADVASQASAATLQGGTLSFSAAGGALFVDQAQVQAPFDWVTGNAVIHAIDSVLQP